MEQIVILDVDFKFGEMDGTIHPVILRDEKEVILVDCGYTGFLDKMEAAIRQAGMEPSQITKVIITHQDHDHIGSLAALKQKYPEIQVIASSAEAPYISGELKPLRLVQAEAFQEHLPEEQKEFGKAFCNILRSVQPVPVDLKVQGGDHFDWCGGCEIIDTSGHTPGHISLYLKKHGAIITGDAAALENEYLVVANPQFTLDMDKAQQAISKLFSYDARTYICYHGGVFYKT